MHINSQLRPKKRIKLDVCGLSQAVSVFAECTAHARRIGAVNLSQGLPEPMPNRWLTDTLASATESEWSYAPFAGNPPLRAAIAQRFYPRLASSENILITSGCTESLFVAIHAIHDSRGLPVTRVAFFEPYYPYYVGLCQLSGVISTPIRMVQQGDGLEPDWSQVEEVLKEGVDILLLNSPHNPTGWVLSHEQGILLRNLTDRYGTHILIDEAYKSFIYDSNHATAIDILMQGNDRCMAAGSCSKMLSAPGLRVGWLTGHSDLIRFASIVHAHITFCQPPPLQAAAAAALSVESGLDLASLTRHYMHKRDMLSAGLRAAGLEFQKPHGGHFILASYAGLSSAHSADFVYEFAERYRIMPLPTTPFFKDRDACSYVRFSFAVDAPAIELAVSHLKSKASSIHGQTTSL